MTHSQNEINAAKSYFAKNDGVWFLVDGKPSIHREDVFGYEAIYERD